MFQGWKSLVTPTRDWCPADVRNARDGKGKDGTVSTVHVEDSKPTDKKLNTVYPVKELPNQFVGVDGKYTKY